MKPTVVRNIERPDAALVRRLGEFGVAAVHESQGRTGLMRPYMRPIFPEARLAGPAVTVSCPAGDNLMLHAAIELCRPGDVLVVAPLSASEDGMVGELIGTSCQARGIAGIVLEAGVRDVADLTEMKYPVFSKTISAQGTLKESAGSVNVAVVCAGAAVQPGDIIVADLDGVVVVPRHTAADVVRAAEERTVREKRKRERLRSGELAVEIDGLRAKLKELGVEYVERAPDRDAPVPSAKS
jgi:4-hydroxy-4-methyl-2-oxoglutarate aldolase